ncbi:MAG: hypothetical protein K9M57_05830 [Phycisphaerae bacterium]|nr:hypothetical protein [Phycisphaerae bacterium]
MPNILETFNPKGGFIITDGSNSRGSNYKKMKRNSGLKKYGWHIQKVDEQPFENDYNLLVFSVLPHNIENK